MIYLFTLGFLMLSIYCINHTAIAIAYIIMAVLCSVFGSVMNTTKGDVFMLYLYAAFFTGFSFYTRELTPVAIVFIVAGGVLAMWGALATSVYKTNIKKEEKKRERERYVD